MWLLCNSARREGSSLYCQASPLIPPHPASNPERARQNFMIGRATKSRSTRWSGLRFEASESLTSCKTVLHVYTPHVLAQPGRREMMDSTLKIVMTVLAALLLAAMLVGSMSQAQTAAPKELPADSHAPSTAEKTEPTFRGREAPEASHKLVTMSFSRCAPLGACQRPQFTSRTMPLKLLRFVSHAPINPWFRW
jgi:hypothetical protein